MIFNSDKPIFLQMADRLCDEILADKYKDDDRIPSVREYAVLLEVNTNTAVKAYDELAQAGVYERAVARALPTDAIAGHYVRRC